MEFISDPLNLILISAAAFIFWRLKSVLGTRTGHERPPEAIRPKIDPQPAPVPDDLPPSAPKPPVWEGHVAQGSSEAQALEAMAAADSQFNVPHFLEGARAAYEMIITAFAQGNKPELKPLLAADVYDSFCAAIDARAQLGESLESKLVAINKAQIETAEINGPRASITIRFVSEFISARKSRTGEVLEGDAKKIREIIDIWTFERNIKSRDPNWRLAVTEAPE